MAKASAEKLCRALADALESEDEDATVKALAALDALDDDVRRQAVREALIDDDETLLLVAAMTLHLGAVRSLIAWGADIEACDGNGQRPLTAALREHRWKDGEAVILALIEAGADCLREGMFGMTPLHYAAGTGSPAIIRALLDAGADVNARSANRNGKAPIHDAADDGNTSAVELLIGAGAATDIADGDGQTGLHLACEYGHVETVKAFIRAGCNPDHPDPKGRTPLHFAARNGEHDMIRVLMIAGADPLAEDFLGQTPMQILTAFDDLAVLKTLDETVRPWMDDPLDERARLAVFMTVVMQNWTSSDVYVSTSFLGHLHERHVWLPARYRRLCDALDGLAEPSVPGRRHPIDPVLARCCYDIGEAIQRMLLCHMSTNDAFTIENVDIEDAGDVLAEAEIALSRFYARGDDFADGTAISDLVDRELALRRNADLLRRSDPE
ncbi:MAG: ankyrin repeat domain-containing protein [Pseudomonadota bacterium]